MKLERRKTTLAEAATSLAQAEQDRATLFRPLVPPQGAFSPGKAPSGTIDLPALLSVSSVDDSLCSIFLELSSAMRMV